MENTSTLGRRIKVSVPDETVNAQIKAKIEKLAKDAHLKGFRRGKVPLSVIQKQFGKSVKNEVIDELIRQSIGDFLNEKKIQPAGSPRIEEVKTHAGHLEFVATFDIYPEITLAEMSDVEIKKRKVSISDAEVSKMIEKLQDQLGNWLPVDRKVVKGDRLNVDFARQLKTEGSKPEDQKDVTMVVGSDGVLPGLSEALIGKEKGAHVELDLRYPDDWADLPAAGKEVNLSVTINDIQEKQLLTKEELTEKLNIEKDEVLEAKVRERMQHESDQVLQDELKETVLEKLLEKNPIDLPHSLIEQEKIAIQRELSREKKAGHFTQDAFSLEDIEAQAKQRVELGLLLNEVIKKYALKADRQKVRNAIEKAAARFSKPAEIINAYYSNKELLYSVERMVLLEQAVETLLKEIKVIEEEATFNEVMNPEDAKDSSNQNNSD